MESHDPLQIVGTTIADKYEIEAVVGEGGFGIVYRALHKIWKQPVAIKCFKALMEVPADARDKLLQDFIQEGALLTQLSGRTASIVQARDVGTFTSASGAWVPYMVLEWLDGTTLEGIIDADRARHGQTGGSRWPLSRVMQVLEPVAMGLEAAHRRGIAHRDIKPANIFVIGAVGSDEMHVKVLDFGIAKVVMSAAEHGSFTKTGGSVTSFTPAYGAPEQFSRAQGATGPWTDVYALALVMTELLIGRPPLEGDDFIQLGMATADPGRRPTPGAFGVQVEPALERALAKALAVRPQNRFATAGEFWQAVRASQNMPNLKMSQDPVIHAATEVAPPGGFPGAGPNPLSSGPRSAASAATGPTGMVDGPVTSPRSTGTPVTSVDSGTPKRSKGTPLVIGALAVVAVGVGGFLALAKGNAKAGADGAPSPSAVVPAASVPAPGAAPSAKAALASCPDRSARIDGGKFFMGTDDKDADEDERPAHQVVLSPYCIDLYEVTVAEYKACSDVGECKRPPIEVEWKGISSQERRVFSPLCNGQRSDRAEHPINCVDWDMASTYCAWKKGRLPTEAEWEFAARGPDGRRYPWGDEPPDSHRMNACGKECLLWGAKNGVAMGVHGKGMYNEDDGFPTTAPVGSFPAGKSRFGLFDVVGNVWEWTSDWDGKYPAEAAVDPKGPASGERRIVRGGAFNGAMPSWVRPTQRYSDEPRAHSHAYGFRCVKAL